MLVTHNSSTEYQVCRSRKLSTVSVFSSEFLQNAAAGVSTAQPSDHVSKTAESAVNFLRFFLVQVHSAACKTIQNQVQGVDHGLKATASVVTY